MTISNTLLSFYSCFTYFGSNMKTDNKITQNMYILLLERKKRSFFFQWKTTQNKIPAVVAVLKQQAYRLP